MLIHLHIRLISDVAYLDIKIESPYEGEEQGYFSSSSSNGQIKYNIQHATFILFALLSYKPLRHSLSLFSLRLMSLPCLVQLLTWYMFDYRKFLEN